MCVKRSVMAPGEEIKTQPIAEDLNIQDRYKTGPEDGIQLRERKVEMFERFQTRLLRTTKKADK